jgi:hypothetical protein
MKYVLTVAANILSLTILAPVTQVATSSVVEAKVRMYDYPNYGYCPGTLRPVENLETCGRTNPNEGTVDQSAVMNR